MIIARACFLIIFLLPVAGITQQLLPEGFLEMTAVSLQEGNLTVDFIDNSEKLPAHRAGYNGIAGLYHRDQDTNIFVPAYAGFNLEHIFGGDSLMELFEPRKHQMQLFVASNKKVLLYQSPSPLSKVESLTEFTLVDSNYIDITFSCVLHDSRFFKHRYAGLFWASYINSPQDKHIYFQGMPKGENSTRWISAFSKLHGDQSTHRHVDDHRDYYFATNFNASLASHFSEFNFAKFFYFGKFKNMVLAYFFKSDQIIRFSQSPTGGGATNPAWDFQMLIPDPVVGKIYGFKARLVYKPFISAEDIEKEFDHWIP
jgi:hypothetical protein